MIPSIEKILDTFMLKDFFYYSIPEILFPLPFPFVFVKEKVSTEKGNVLHISMIDRYPS